MLSTSIEGEKTAALCTARSTSSSSRQRLQPLRCASTRARAPGAIVPCRTSGSSSWISLSMHSFIFQELLYRPNCVVIMNPRRAFRAVNDLGDLLVRQPLLHPEREHLSLRGRE